MLVAVLATVLGLCAVTDAASARPARTPLAAEATPTFSASDVPASPGFAGSPSITAADCPAKGVCVAGGDVFRIFESPGARPILDVLAGGAWRNVTTPVLPDTYDGTVSAVDCASATYCAALVTTRYFSASARTVVDGPSWLIQLAGPSLSGVRTQQLPEDATYSRIDCPAAGSCVLAGRTTDAGLPRFATLLDGSLRYASSASGALPAGLTAPAVLGGALTCTSVTWCVQPSAAFDADDDLVPFFDTLARGRWQPTPVPLPSGAVAGSAAVSTVVCPRAGSCTAYGSATVDGQQRLLQFTLARGRWSVATLSLPDGVVTSPGYGVSRVSCSGPVDCAGVGDLVGSDAALLYSQSGAIHLARVGAGTYDAASLGDVDCPATNACLATGQRTSAKPTGPASKAIVTLRFGSWVRTYELPPAPTPSGYGTSGGIVACAPTADFCLTAPRSQDFRDYRSYLVTIS